MSYQILSSNTQPESIAAYARLLSEVFTQTRKFTPEYLAWQYARNPHGQVVGSDAYQGGELVAHHGTLPVAYRFFGETLKGVLALNNVTHPAHQGKGLFTRLGLNTFEQARSLGYDFVITVTNANSTPGYLGKFGFRLISPLDVKVGLGRVAVPPPDPGKVCALWTPETLAWRFANPDARYYTNGLSVLTKAGGAGIRAQVKSLAEQEVGKLSLGHLGLGLAIWIGLSGARRQKGLFVNLPDRLKPSPLNLLFKDLGGKVPAFGKDDIQFELADFDAF